MRASTSVWSAAFAALGVGRRRSAVGRIGRRFRLCARRRVRCRFGLGACRFGAARRRGGRSLRFRPVRARGRVGRFGFGGRFRRGSLGRGLRRSRPACRVAGFSSAVSSAAGVDAASRAASSWSAAACRAASSRRRSRSASSWARAASTSSAALRAPSRTSVTRRTVSSCRWPFLTRRRAFGRYLKEISFSPRAWRSTWADTTASVTRGRPMAASSPSATSRTRSSVMSEPGSTSRSSTSSSVPTSTRYCFPPVSMTAYMDPQEVVGGRREPGMRAPRGQHGTAGVIRSRTWSVRAGREERQTRPGRRFGSQPQSFAMRILRDERASCQHAQRGHDLLRPPGAERRVEAKPHPEPVPLEHADDVDQRPQVAGRTIGSTADTLDRRCGEQGRDCCPEVARCVIEQRRARAAYDTNAVVAGNHLPRQSGLSDPDVVEVHEPVAVGELRRKARTHIGQRPTLGQEQVGQVGIGRHSSRHRRREDDPRGPEAAVEVRVAERRPPTRSPALAATGRDLSPTARGSAASAGRASTDRVRIGRHVC